ncbi:hypothetical protein B0T16DRAFT_423598 [Cercophora newfieldiana]|uniref:2EXR domain-containing protein n=1 Tax=Cercophora newfieldiana TaxID=92897 RepID=A0AA40CIK4_9PEZI|nr:hypothetical protein B0T16DRAFT_423598 [Cercophora newfieldiana]
MFQHRSLPDDWKDRVADPSNPTYLECGALGFHHLKPGKQCAHPSNSWFRDPRPNPPPLRSRTSILTSIFREHTTFDHTCQDILASYLPREDPERLAREHDEDATARTFPQFMLLPLEIREHIWELALPRRTFDLREARHVGTYTEFRNFLPPVPYIGQVCREARAVVMRLGTRLSYAWTDQFAHDWPGGHTSSVKVSAMGFFVMGRDMVLHMPDPSSGPELMLSEAEKVKPSGMVDGVSATTLTAGTMQSVLRCPEMGVNWSPSARPANARSYPGSILPKPWRTLRTTSPDLETVYVYYRSRFIEVSMWMDDGFFKRWAHIGWITEVQLLVDLYDDQRIAELQSLETVGTDDDKTGPRFANFGLRNPGLCLNCERVHWEEHIKPAAVCQWLQLFEEELDELMYQSVFRPGSALGYDPEHPWAKEKLKEAPKFRPAILVLLQVARGKESENPAVLDYNSRVTALR